ncbi:MAG: metallophosphoesterase family protein [Candidatus Sericytochromatia bacterium]|nr:metallophosphoesterase family protein [Candidatus Sericytochromatia bacterium]
MRIGLVADTHLPRFGRSLPPPLVAGLQQADVSLILHAGDFTEPEVADWLSAMAPLEAVAGTIDGPVLTARFGRRRIVSVAGVRIGLIHGDGQTGNTPERAWAAFANDDVQAIVYGHSHQPWCEFRAGRWLINPGSPSDKRREPLFSFGVLTVNGATLHPRILAYPDKTRVPAQFTVVADGGMPH